MKYVPVYAAVLLFPVAAAGESAACVDPEIQQAIEAFEPAWIPPRGEIAGLAVLLNPLATSPADETARADDRLALHACGYLFHLLRFGGALPAMARADVDALLRESDSASEAALAAYVEEARPHCLVAVRVDRSVGKGRRLVHVPAGDRLARSMADAVAMALDGEAVASASPPMLGVPSITIAVTPAADSGEEAVPLHRTLAERVYKGLSASLREHRDELASVREKRWPGAQASRSDSEGVRLPQTEERKIEMTARTIWPAGDLPLEKAAWFCSMFRRVSLSDVTIVHFEPQVAVEGETVVLRGATTVPPLRDTLAVALQAVGVGRVRNEMRILPEQADLGDRPFGACIAASARTFSRAAGLSAPQTQLLYGEPLFLLDRADGWLLVQAGDGYWGWLREDLVRTMTREEFVRYHGGPQAVLVEDLETGGLPLCAGVRLPIASRLPDGFALRRPDGPTVEVSTAAVRRLDGAERWRDRLPTAVRWLYTPYLFGGRSTAGLDCSGLVYNLCEQVGEPVARDATQQLLAGKLAATRWYRDAIQPGDRVYFIDRFGKIFHTGVAITPTHVLHSAPPAVQISRLRKGDRLYEPHWDESFFVAKRP